MRGIVQSGGTPGLHTIEPIANATVTLYESIGGPPAVVGQPAITAKDGSFSIDTPSTTSSSIFFATATLGEGVVLMTLIGPELPESVTLNELTTVSACYCAAQFLSGSLIEGETLPLRIAAAMNANIVNVVDGTSSAVLVNSPNGNETAALRVTRSLANFLASVVRDPKIFLESFFLLAGVPKSVPGESRERTTIAALGNIARSPARNAGGIYEQSQAVTIYQPAVQQQPDAWTIVVKVNDSGDDANMFAGTGNVAFDKRGRAWITNNVIQGGPDSSPVSAVLDIAGHPALNDSGERMSPYTGGGVLGAGFGVAIDSQQRVWIGDFGWSPTTLPTGSVSLFDSNANPLSPAEGFTAGLNRVQGIAIDGDGNVWMASWGNGAVVVYPGAGNATSWSADSPWYSYPETPDPNFKPFDIAFASDGTAWVTDSYADSSGVLHLRFTGTGFEKLHEKRIGKVMKGVVIDSAGFVWTASGGDDTVYRFDAEGNLLGAYQGGGCWGPWGICLDGDDNVWVGNFGPLEPGSVVHGRLTQLAGVNAKDHIIGTGLTPQTGYTLPTAGNPVLLHNGTPLYGPGGPPCYIPMMRTTGLAVDAAGNVWTCNNWKPDFDIDIGDPVLDVPGNPGGDGMLIWVGLAKPMAY